MTKQQTNQCQVQCLMDLLKPYICYLLVWPFSSPRDESAKQCPRIGVLENFLPRRRGSPLTKTTITRKQKVEQSIQRCKNDRNVEGHKRAIEENLGPRANKNCECCPLSVHFGQVPLKRDHSNLPPQPLILSTSKYFRQISLSFYLHPNISDRFPSHFIFVGAKMNTS